PRLAGGGGCASPPRRGGGRPPPPPRGGGGGGGGGLGGGGGIRYNRQSLDRSAPLVRRLSPALRMAEQSVSPRVVAGCCLFFVGCSSNEILVRNCSGRAHRRLRLSLFRPCLS